MYILRNYLKIYSVEKKNFLINNYEMLSIKYIKSNFYCHLEKEYTSPERTYTTEEEISNEIEKIHNNIRSGIIYNANNDKYLIILKSIEVDKYELDGHYNLYSYYASLDKESILMLLTDNENYIQKER